MTKVKCLNDDCYWCSRYNNCIKNEIKINVDLICTCYEPKEYEGDDTDDET